MNDAAAQYQGYLVGMLIVAPLGIGSLLGDDFAGYYYQGNTGSAGFGSGAVETSLILIGVAGLALGFYSALKSLRSEDATVAFIQSNAKLAIQGGLLAIVIALIGAILWVGNYWYTEWWLDNGFYGAFLGGAFVSFFGWLIDSDVRREREIPS